MQIQKPSLRNAKFEISSLLENKLTLQRKCSWFNWHWSRPARSNWSTFASNWSIFWIGQYSKFDNISSESIFWIGQYVASWGLLYRTWVRPLRGLVTNLLAQLQNAVEWCYSGWWICHPNSCKNCNWWNFFDFCRDFFQQLLVGKWKIKSTYFLYIQLCSFGFPDLFIHWCHKSIFSSNC